MNDQTKTFKIYYDGRIDYIATYTPVFRRWIKRQLWASLDALDRLATEKK